MGVKEQEKVLHGLNSCGFHDGIPNICEVTECPYRENKSWCVHDLAHDAGILIAKLLKAQEPRVMTLEEMEQAGKNGDAVYVETADDIHFWALAFPGIEPPKDKPFNYPGGVQFNVQNVDGDIYDGDFYGMTMPDGRVHHLAWRCWTSRPDEKRRAETPWN